MTTPHRVGRGRDAPSPNLDNVSGWIKFCAKSRFLPNYNWLTELAPAECKDFRHEKRSRMAWLAMATWHRALNSAPLSKHLFGKPDFTGDRGAHWTANGIQRLSDTVKFSDTKRGNDCVRRHRTAIGER